MSSPTSALSPLQPQRQQKPPETTNKPIIFSETPMEGTYEKLAARLRSKVLDTTSDVDEFDHGQQYWVAIAGGPGSGKSTTAEAVRDLLNEACGGDEERCVVLPMDGFHFSKKMLRQLDPPDGEKFLERRGAPWTMDAELCYELLKKARQEGHGELPTYSREISDPVPGGVTLKPHHKVVLVEGLYLLWNDDPRWKKLQELWDEKWFIRCPSREEQRERLIERSLENWGDLKVFTFGPGRKGAETKVDANDALNMDIVAEAEKYADVVIESR